MSAACFRDAVGETSGKTEGSLVHSLTLDRRQSTPHVSILGEPAHMTQCVCNEWTFAETVRGGELYIFKSWICGRLESRPVVCAYFSDSETLLHGYE